jgi:serine/threonine protein phosphatase PrpC
MPVMEHQAKDRERILSGAGGDLVGIQSYIQAAMTRPACLPLAGSEAVIFTAPGPGREGPNEDAAAVLALGARQGLLILADGFGGHLAGEEASALAVRQVAEAVRQAFTTTADTACDKEPGAGTNGAAAPQAPRPDGDNGTLRTAVLAGFDGANLAVSDLGVGAATTLVAVEIRDGWIRPYHVGDSEVLVTGQRGKLKLRTVPHSPAGYAVEAGIVGPDDALHHEERHLVSNLVGSKEMRIELGAPLKLAAYDTVLVGSDGLYDNLTEDEIIARVRRGPLPEAVAALVAAAHQRMLDPRPGQPSKLDDLTVIAFRRGPLTRSHRRITPG